MCCIKGPKTSMCALKETLTFCISTAEIAKNQTHNLILHVADTKGNLNSHFVSVSTVQLSILIGKERLPESWDVWDVCTCGKTLRKLGTLSP